MVKNIFLNTSHKIRSIWWIPIFLFLLAILLLPVILFARKNSVEVSITIQAAIIITATFICQFLRKQPLTLVTGRFNSSWLKQFGMGLALGTIIMVVPAIFLTFLGYANWQVNELSVSTVISGFSFFTAVAVAEEMLFRGFIFQRLMESLGQWPAQIVISGMFLLTHINNPGMIGMTKTLAALNIFIASVMFGLAFIKTKSLAMPVGIHFMANFMQGTVLGFGVSGVKEQSLVKAFAGECPVWLNGGEFGLEASVPGLLMVILVTVILYYWKPADKGKEI